MRDEEVFYMLDGVEYCNYDMALAQLLQDGVLFVYEGANPFFLPPAGTPTRLTLAVNSNDVFWWAMADAENLPLAEVGPLYKMHVADPRWGATKWACLRRKMRPQKPLEDRMRKAGAWDDAMEALPPRGTL